MKIRKNVVAVIVTTVGLVVLGLYGYTSYMNSYVNANNLSYDNYEKTPSREFIETVDSIGQKMFVDENSMLFDDVPIYSNALTEIEYYLQEQRAMIETDKQVAEHDDEDLDYGDSVALPDVGMDFDSLGIPTTPEEEIEQAKEVVEERMKVKLVDASYYTEGAILKYANDDGSFFKILEVEGNNKGIESIKVIDKTPVAGR